MADAARIVMRPDCRGITLDGRKIDAQDGAVLVPGHSRKEFARAGVDALAEKTWSLGRTSAAEVRCVDCGHKTLALFGAVCHDCGGRREPV